MELEDAYIGGLIAGKKQGSGTEKVKVFAALSTGNGYSAYQKNLGSFTVPGELSFLPAKGKKEAPLTSLKGYATITLSCGENRVYSLTRLFPKKKHFMISLRMVNAHNRAIYYL